MEIPVSLFLWGRNSALSFPLIFPTKVSPWSERFSNTSRQEDKKKISRYVAVSFGNLAHISQKSSGWRFRFSHCCSLYNHPNPCHCRCMCCIGNCFWHPQERELINHILTVSSVFTFWRNICRQKILSCHLYSHNSQCRWAVRKVKNVCPCWFHAPQHNHQCWCLLCCTSTSW